MSTPAPPELFAGLLDDAAVFPPGSFSLPDALDRRRRRHRSPVVRYTGPLLLPGRLLDEALAETEPLDIGVIGRPGADLAELIEAARRVATSSTHALAGVELPYADGWRAALELGVPLAVEVPPGPEGIDRLADLAAATGSAPAVRAKLRTGSTPATPVPTAYDLASFIHGCVRRDLPFKLTGGLHHAVTGTFDDTGTPEDQFGFLDVLTAVDTAVDGGSIEDLTTLLGDRDATRVAGRVRALTRGRAARIRRSFHSYGCCNVLDPIHDLTHLALIKESFSE